MRKFIFSLKSLAMTLALVVGGSAWAQITSLPFVADFSSGAAPFGEPAFKTGTTAIGDVVAVTAGTAEATFAVGGGAYALGNAEEVTVSFTMFNGWLGGGTDNTFAVLNSDGATLASISYNANNCNIVDVKLGGSTVEGFEAFAGQSKSNVSGKGANGYTHKQTYVANTDEAKNNGEVTIKINSYGGLSLSFVGAMGDVDKFFSATAPAGTKLDLAKLTISNGSNNGDRASGYGNLSVTSKSLIKYSNDYSDEVVTWTTATSGRFTPIIQDGYLTVNQDQRNNNGTTITSTETEGKVAAGESFTMSFDVKLGASTNQTATAFNIFDAANSAAILSFAEGATYATAWTINVTQTATVSAGGNKGIDELSWISVKVTSIAGGKTYLTLKDAEGSIIDGFDKKDIPTLSETGGLGKMNFVTSRYLANFAIDNIVVRDVVESEDIPATPIYTYTVKYVDQDGFEFKEPAKREEYAEVELAITDDDKATVIHENIQYTYVSDDAAGQTAASDGSTVVTVKFNKTIVTNYTVNFFDTSNGTIRDAITHKNVLVGTEVSATQGELSKILKEGVFYEYASGNEPITLVEDAAANVINLYFAPVDGVTGYFFNNYENRAVDWTTATGGRYDPVVVDGSTIVDRSTTEKKPKTDPETGEPIINPETGEQEYEEVPGLDIPFANKSYFLTVNQAQRNNNGVTNGVSSASLAVEQADFTLETKIILGTSNNQGCSFQIKNFAGDANILQLIPTAVGSTTWVVNGDAEKFAVELPGTGNFGGTDNNNLTNYNWYDLKVTVYNGTTFVTIVDQNDNVILDKAQVPTLATTYGVGKMIFYTGRYNSNIAVDDVTVRSVVESEDVPAGAEFVAVKINYVDEAGTPVKPADEAKFQVGQPIVLNSAFVADFKVDAEGNVWTAESESAPVTKYIYVSDNSADVPAALDAQVNIVFRGVAPRRVALRPQYQTVEGEITTKDASGKNLSFFYDSNKTGDYLFEGDVLTYYYPYYLLVDGLLYKTGNNSGGTDKGTLDIEAGTSTLSKSPVTWTPAMETVPVIDPETQEPAIDPETQEPITEEVQISNAVFAQETENIEGITPVKDGYTTIRMANGATGSAIGGDVLVTTLEPGTYTITTATRSGTTNFKAAGNVVATITSSGTVSTITSEEFTVDQATDLFIEEQASTTQYSDYVLVRKTAELETYKITLNMNATEYGVVNVPASAAVGATITPVFTPAPGYQVESYEISVVDAEGAPVTVLDGSFIMPASDVTVTASAVFVPKKIYIETDLTADFDALTNWRNWTGATGYTATNFCPAVVTNAGKTVQVCEKYDGTCANTGDVLTQTVNGLTPGTYKIELYGGAAFTFGRGFGSIAFTGDLSIETSETHQAGDKIEPTVENPTGVSLQATTSEGIYGGEIPIYYATNFPDGAAVVTIDGVEVGQNGVLTIGMSKTSQSTNWHVIQLKGVTAQVLASDLLAKSVAKISGYTEDDLTPEMYSAVQEALVTYNKAYDTAEEYLTAIAAIDAVAEAALPVAELVKNTKAVEGATYSNPVETAFVVNGTFDSAIAPWITTTGAQNSALASNQQGAFTVPFWENWNPNPYTGKMYQTIKNIPNGVYTLKIAAFVNNFAGDNQASQYVYANEFKTYLTTGEPTAYEVKDVVVTDNTLEIGFEQTEAVANWAGIDNVSLLYHGATLPFEITVVPSENGSLNLPAKAGAGETIAIVANPAVGYELASVMITGVNTNIAVPVDVDEWTGEMSFTMPEDDVTVTATFQEAYVKLSDYAVTVDPTFVYDPEFGDEIIATITYKSEIVGSYAESFMLNAQFDYEVKDASGKVVTTGTKNPLNVSDNKVTAYIDGLAENTTYTINITGVEVTDFDLATFEDVVVFKEVIGLDGNPLATATFTTVKPFIAELNVERYVGQGYNTTVAEVDFSAAEEYLGINGVTTDMLRIVNPDGTTISDYAPYDGWFDGDGKAETWGANTKINVKFFEALTDGKYTICDMNGADVVDATYTVRWAIEANDKVAFFNINVKFVEQPTVAPEIAAEVDVPVLLKSGTAYEGATAAFNVLDVTAPLNLDAISDAEQYIVNVTDGSFVANSTDGWRDANGDAAAWGTAGEGMVCVKIGDPASGIIDYLGAIDDSYEDGDTYTAKWGFVNKASNTAVILNINITFVTDPTGIESTPAADGVKPDGKYLENGKIVIYRNGNKYDASGAPMNK